MMEIPKKENYLKNGETVCTTYGFYRDFNAQNGENFKEDEETERLAEELDSLATAVLENFGMNGMVFVMSPESFEGLKDFSERRKQGTEQAETVYYIGTNSAGIVFYLCMYLESRENKDDYEMESTLFKNDPEENSVSWMDIETGEWKRDPSFEKLFLGAEDSEPMTEFIIAEEEFLRHPLFLSDADEIARTAETAEPLFDLASDLDGIGKISLFTAKERDGTVHTVPVLTANDGKRRGMFVFTDGEKFCVYRESVKMTDSGRLFTINRTAEDKPGSFLEKAYETNIEKELVIFLTAAWDHCDRGKTWHVFPLSESAFLSVPDLNFSNAEFRTLPGGRQLTDDEIFTLQNLKELFCADKEV